MGSWNETCAITNLPIMDGEEAICLVLPDVKYENDRSFRFEEEIAIFDGTYQDYGFIHPVISEYNPPGYSSDFQEEYIMKKRPVIFFKKTAWLKVVTAANEDKDLAELLANFWENFASLTKFKIRQDSFDETEKRMSLEESDTAFDALDLHLLKEWMSVRTFLYKVRRSYVRNNLFSGNQSDSYDLHKQLLKITKSELSASG